MYKWLAVLALGLLAAGCEARDDDTAPVVIVPESAVLDGLPFSPGVRAGDFLFLSGAIGNRPGTTELVSADVGEQTRQTLDNLARVLEAGGAGLGDVVKCTVFLVDMADYAAMNEAYAAVWPGSPPARSTVAGSGLALGARVEIECIAYVGGAP
ncbi:MAG: RidA family protein [Longimicrobiales bacterium]|nr:RidA family protein [Longimicrobiales bacterium]